MCKSFSSVLRYIYCLDNDEVICTSNDCKRPAVPVYLYNVQVMEDHNMMQGQASTTKLAFTNVIAEVAMPILHRCIQACPMYDGLKGGHHTYVNTTRLARHHVSMSQARDARDERASWSR